MDQPEAPPWTSKSHKQLHVLVKKTAREKTSFNSHNFCLSSRRRLAWRWRWNFSASSSGLYCYVCIALHITYQCQSRDAQRDVEKLSMHDEEEQDYGGEGERRKKNTKFFWGGGSCAWFWCDLALDLSQRKGHGKVLEVFLTKHYSSMHTICPGATQYVQRD